MGIDKGKYHWVRRPWRHWQASAAIAAGIAIFAVVMVGFEHTPALRAHDVTGAGTSNEVASSPHDVSVPILGGKPLNEIFRSTIQNNGSSDKVEKAVYFESKTDGRAVPGVQAYFKAEGGLMATILYGKSFIVIATGSFHATGADGGTSLNPANTAIVAYDAQGNVEQSYYLNMSTSAFNSMETQLTQTGSPHDLPLPTQGN